MNEETIRQIVRDEISKAGSNSQYSVVPIPSHIHNGVDTAQIPPTSVLNFASMPSNNANNSLNPTDDSGVLSTTNLGLTSIPPYGIVYPTPVVRGSGAGVHASFNGGVSPLGTLLAFIHPSVAAPELWIRLEDVSGTPAWYGVTLTAL